MMGVLMYAILWYGQWFFRTIGWWRWEIRGLENLPPRDQGGMVVAVNHLHWFDVMILGGSLPFSYRLSWIAKIEVFNSSVARWFFRQMNVIPIRRGARDMAALEAAEEALKRGAVLTIFVEGHRNPEGELQQGRGGAVRMAARAGVPIVPIAIEGTQGGLRGAFGRRHLRVSIGKPYHPDSNGHHIPPKRMDELTEEMMLKIAALLPEQYRGYYRERLLEMAPAGSPEPGAQSQE